MKYLQRAKCQRTVCPNVEDGMVHMYTRERYCVVCARKINQFAPEVVIVPDTADFARDYAALAIDGALHWGGTRVPFRVWTESDGDRPGYDWDRYDKSNEWKIIL